MTLVRLLDEKAAVRVKPGKAHGLFLEAVWAHSEAFVSRVYGSKEKREELLLPERPPESYGPDPKRPSILQSAADPLMIGVHRMVGRGFCFTITSSERGKYIHYSLVPEKSLAALAKSFSNYQGKIIFSRTSFGGTEMKWMIDTEFIGLAKHASSACVCVTSHFKRKTRDSFLPEIELWQAACDSPACEWPRQVSNIPEEDDDEDTSVRESMGIEKSFPTA